MPCLLSALPSAAPQVAAPPLWSTTCASTAPSSKGSCTPPWCTHTWGPSEGESGGGGRAGAGRERGRGSGRRLGRLPCVCGRDSRKQAVSGWGGLSRVHRHATSCPRPCHLPTAPLLPAAPRLDLRPGELPRCFEAELRRAPAASRQLLQLVSGRTLLGAVRVRVSAWVGAERRGEGLLVPHVPQSSIHCNTEAKGTAGEAQARCGRWCQESGAYWEVLCVAQGSLVAAHCRPCHRHARGRRVPC